MYGALRRQNRPPPRKRPESLEEVSEPQAGIRRHTGVGFELVLNPVVPQMAEQLVEVSLPALAVEYTSPASAVFQASSPVVEHIVPVTAVFQASTPVVEHIAPAPAVLQAPTPVVESLAPAPELSESPAPGGCLSPAPGVFRVGGLQGSVPGQSSTSRRRHDLPLPSGWRRADDAFGRVYDWHVHTRQTRWTPPVSDEDEEDEEDEEVEDEDMDEFYGTEYRFPAGFWPMRMCWCLPSGNCRQGRGCMFAHSANELHPKLVVKCPDDFYWRDGFWKMSMYSAPCMVRLWIHAHASVHATFGRFLHLLFLAVACSTVLA